MCSLASRPLRLVCANHQGMGETMHSVRALRKIAPAYAQRLPIFVSGERYRYLVLTLSLTGVFHPISCQSGLPTIRELSHDLSKSEALIGDLRSYPRMTLLSQRHALPQIVEEVYEEHHLVLLLGRFRGFDRRQH